MKRKVSIALLAGALFLFAGCFEEVYISSAPDGTIAVCLHGKLFTINPEMAEARLVADRHKTVRAEYSPGGKWWLGVYDMGEGDQRYFEVVLRDVAGKSCSLVNRMTVGSDEGKQVQMIRPRWSPDGRFVSYLLASPSVDEFLDLHVNEVKGPGHFVIPKVSAAYAWSPDSGQIAVMATDSDDPDTTVLGSIQVWDVVKQEKIHEPAGLLFHPWLSLEWVNEGRSLIFAAHTFAMPLSRRSDLEHVPLQVFSVDLDGGNLRPLLAKPGLSTGVAGMFDVSPDGKRIAYVVWDPTIVKNNYGLDLAGDIWVADIDGSNREKVIANAKEISVYPRWLGDGRLACMVAMPGEDEGHIWIVDSEGKKTDLMPLIKPIVERLEKQKGAENAEGDKRPPVPDTAETPAEKD